MKELFLNKSLVTGKTLTVDGVLAYVTLRIIMDESIPLYNKSKSTDCISINRLAYSLVGDMNYEKALTDALVRGIAELASGEWISIRKDLSTKTNYEYVLDVTNLYLDTDRDKFVIVSPDDIYKIMACKEVMKKKISMLKYYIALVSTFDWSLERKIGHMSQQYIAEQAGNSVRTCQRYNKILKEIKVIYVHKSNDKVRENSKLKQIKNCYSRYEDMSTCALYASNYEDMYGIHKVVASKKNKKQADKNRRLAAIYNQICEGNTNYDEGTIKEVYKYIVNKNKALQEEIDEKYKQTYMSASDEEWVKDLESQKREVSIFKQFDFITLQSDKSDETDSMIDFSIEEILEMPKFSEVTNSDLDIHSDFVIDDDIRCLLGDEEFADLF